MQLTKTIALSTLLLTLTACGGGGGGGGSSSTGTPSTDSGNHSGSNSSGGSTTHDQQISLSKVPLREFSEEIEKFRSTQLEPLPANWGDTYHYQYRIGGDGIYSNSWGGYTDTFKDSLTLDSQIHQGLCGSGVEVKQMHIQVVKPQEYYLLTCSFAVSIDKRTSHLIDGSGNRVIDLDHLASHVRIVGNQVYTLDQGFMGVTWGGVSFSRYDLTTKESITRNFEIESGYTWVRRSPSSHFYTLEDGSVITIKQSIKRNSLGHGYDSVYHFVVYDRQGKLIHKIEHGHLVEYFEKKVKSQYGQGVDFKTYNLHNNGLGSVASGSALQFFGFDANEVATINDFTLDDYGYQLRVPASQLSQFVTEIANLQSGSSTGGSNGTGGSTGGNNANCESAWIGSPDDVQVSTQCMTACVYRSANMQSEADQVCSIVDKFGATAECTACP